METTFKHMDLPDDVLRMIADSYGDAKFTPDKNTIPGLKLDPLAIQKAIRKATINKTGCFKVKCRFTNLENKLESMGRFLSIFAAEFHGDKELLEVTLEREPGYFMNFGDDVEVCFKRPVQQVA